MNIKDVGKAIADINGAYIVTDDQHIKDKIPPHLRDKVAYVIRLNGERNVIRDARKILAALESCSDMLATDGGAYYCIVYDDHIGHDADDFESDSSFLLIKVVIVTILLTIACYFWQIKGVF